MFHFAKLEQVEIGRFYLSWTENNIISCMGIIFPLFGIFTSFLLIYYFSSLNKSNGYLALFFLICNWIVLIYFGLHYTKDPFWEGICFVHWLPLSYLVGPCLFYYVKTTISGNHKLDKVDFLHLLPAILVGFNCLPFTLLPFNDKAKIAHEIINVTEKYDLDFLFISFGSILISRTLHLLFYCILSIVYFVIYSKRTKDQIGILSTNHTMLKRWIYLLCAIQVIISSNSFLHMLTVVGIRFDFESESYAQIFTSKNHYFGIAGGGFFLQNIFLFLFPKILFGNISYNPAKQNLLNDFKSIIPKKRNQIENDPEIDFEITHYLESNPYLRKDFSLAQMAFDLKITERDLSYYFNVKQQTTFSQWRKKHRINYAIEQLNLGVSQKFTLEAVSSSAGFASRSKFIDAFKEQVGVTPSKYIKSLENK